MSYTKASQGIQFSELARAAEGLIQWRPLVMGFLSILLTTLLSMGAGAAVASIRGVGGIVLGAAIWLLAVIVMLGGVSAVGVMLMDKARHLPPRSFMDAAMFGVLCIPKFILFFLLLGGAVFVFGLLASLLYLLCKIPYVGVVLAFFIHPALVVIAAFFIVALSFVVMPLFAPAVWMGLGFKDVVASLLAIAQKRLVPVVLMLIALYLVVLVIAGLLFAGLVPAAMNMTSLAAAIIPKYSSFHSISMMSSNPWGLLGGFGQGGMSGAMAGLGVLMLAVGALLMQVWLMGLNLMYIQASHGVDTVEASSGLGAALGDIKRRAQDVKDSALAAAERAKQAAAERAAAAQAAQAEQERVRAEQAQLAQQVQSAQEAAKPMHCPSCHAEVQPGDAFCGECGAKLGA